METGKAEAGKVLFKALFEKESFSEEETNRRIELARSQDYWRQLNPQLNVCADLTFDDFEKDALTNNEIDDMLGKLGREGYFSTQAPLIRKEITDRMLLGVENLRKAGWHEVWAFVYDEFWQVTRTPSMLRLLSAHLGKGFMAMPHVVVHYVCPEKGSGWSPHVDFYDRHDRFTVWFPLTDATIDNGCMYIIARHRVSDTLLVKWLNMEDLSHREVKNLLQSTRALPVPAGSILSWKGDVIHWGTISSKNVEPRVSLSVVYIKENTPPLPDEVPLLSPVEVPDFSTRLMSVAKAIKYYKIHVLSLNKFSAIAHELLTAYKENRIA
ncbi:phytanoyl-CoA dioxygenase family protein [Mucilaginibacter sp.]|jgi:hypothetical protein|uniref:phytanoyl-CoA dioxygenase family protein n=1 Tax=Mucilaginibacter sp. TaxID=1882438 RepID=UPI002B5EAE67|nr:phytanoyl-CoA dioxygenase family protein [Mucilaginibacter sp.]HTI60181.1 phytanoyl-CoA dioxygenase family protein [Mucilaginibacter sp.]